MVVFFITGDKHQSGIMSPFNKPKGQAMSVSDYTYFYAFEEDEEDGFIEHDIKETYSVLYLESALEEIDQEWFARMGVISDVETYAKTVLEPYLDQATQEDEEREDTILLHGLYAFLMKWKDYKVMVYAEDQFYGTEPSEP